MVPKIVLAGGRCVVQFIVWKKSFTLCKDARDSGASKSPTERKLVVRVGRTAKCEMVLGTLLAHNAVLVY